MSADVIKEFLVSLGYKVDSTGERKFVDGIHHVTVEATKLGAAAVAAAAAVTAAVVKMSSQLEDLYFMSQRTGAAASNIQAFGFAASQMGSSVEGARGSIEGLAKFLRENPGGEGLLGSIGVQTRDVNGALRDTTDIMQDIGKRLRNMPQYRAIAYANVFGIDYKTLMALEQGVGKFSDRYKDLLHRFGLNVEEATAKSHNLMVAWRDMKASAGILSTIVGTTLIGVFDELQHRWQSLDDTTRQNIETGAKWVAGIVAGTALIMGGPLVWIAALAAGIVGLWDDYQVWKEGGKSLIDWKNWKTEIDLATGGINKLIGVIRTLEHWREKAHDGIGSWAAGKAAAINNGTGPYDARQQGSPLHKFLQNIAYSMGFDPTTGQKIPDKYMGDPGASTGGKNLLDNVMRVESGGNPNARSPAGALGAYQMMPGTAAQYGLTGNDVFDPVKQRKAASAYIHDLLNQFHGNIRMAMAAYNWGPGNVQKHGMGHLPTETQNYLKRLGLGAEGSNPYSAEMMGGSSSPLGAGGGRSGVSLDQKVNIHVHGSDHPQDIGRAVESGMNGANDRLVRNLKPATS